DGSSDEESNEKAEDAAEDVEGHDLESPHPSPPWKGEGQAGACRHSLPNAPPCPSPHWGEARWGGFGEKVLFNPMNVAQHHAFDGGVLPHAFELGVPDTGLGKLEEEAVDRILGDDGL